METVIILILLLIGGAFLTLGIAFHRLTQREVAFKKMTDKATTDLDNERAKSKSQIIEIKARMVIIRAELDAIDKIVK